MTVDTLYRRLMSELSAVTDESENEARLILQKALSLSYTDLLLSKGKTVDASGENAAAELLTQRLSGKPIQYVLGEWDFMGLSFFVGEGVLIPRPETEQLCEFVIERLRKMKSPVVYDLCSGSGCIGLSLKHFVPDSQVYMFEKSAKAIKYLERNRERLGFARSTVSVQGDILKGCDAFSCLPIPDVIVSNPPYIKTSLIPSLQSEVLCEPSLALDGGEDGLMFYRALADKWLCKMQRGFMAVECGDEQADEVAEIFLRYCGETDIIKDYNDKNRIVAAYI